jgi:membrane protein implicated in regulation of membrane protease activity
MTIPGGRRTIVISVIVVVILAAIVGLIYLVPGVGSVLASLGPTAAALITALLAFFGVLIAQIVTVALSLIERWVEYRSEQERAEEKQERETAQAKEEQDDRGGAGRRLPLSVRERAEQPNTVTFVPLIRLT